MTGSDNQCHQGVIVADVNGIYSFKPQATPANISF